MPQFCLISSTCCYQCQLVQFITCSPKSWSCAAFRGQTVRGKQLVPNISKEGWSKSRANATLGEFFFLPPAFSEMPSLKRHVSFAGWIKFRVRISASENYSICPKWTEWGLFLFILFVFFLLCCSPFLSPNLKVVFSSIVSKFIDLYYYFIYC